MMQFIIFTKNGGKIRPLPHIILSIFQTKFQCNISFALQDTFNVMIGKKRSQMGATGYPSKKPKLEIRDEDNYLHYRPSDFASESRFGFYIIYHNNLQNKW